MSFHIKVYFCFVSYMLDFHITKRGLEHVATESLWCTSYFLTSLWCPDQHEFAICGTKKEDIYHYSSITAYSINRILCITAACSNVFYQSQSFIKRLHLTIHKGNPFLSPGYTASQLGSVMSAEKTSKRYNLKLSFLLVITIEGDRTQKKWYRMSLICIHFAVAKQLEYKRDLV